MEKFLKRLSEPSTYAGLAAVIFGVGEVAKLDYSEQVAQTVEVVGQGIVAGGGSTQSLITGAVGLLGGILAIFMREKS